MPWKTLLTALDILAEAGLPDEVDRSVFPTFSGATQAELLTGMRSLGLLDDAAHPTAQLVQLIDSKGNQRKDVVRAVIHEAYRDLLASLDLTKSTASMLDDRIEKIYDIRGSTRKKAVRFLLSAAESSEIPLSPLLSGNRRASNGAPRRRRGPSPKARQVSNVESVAVPVAGVAAGESAMKRIALASGGTLTVSAAYNPFELNEADRNFIDSLIKLVQTYESTVSKPSSAGDSE